MGGTERRVHERPRLNAGPTVIMVALRVTWLCVRTLLERIRQAPRWVTDDAEKTKPAAISPGAPGGPRARQGLVSRVGCTRGTKACEATDGRGAERSGAEGGSGSVERHQHGSTSGTSPKGGARPLEEKTRPVEGDSFPSQDGHAAFPPRPGVRTVPRDRRVPRANRGACVPHAPPPRSPLRPFDGQSPPSEVTRPPARASTRRRWPAAP